MEIVRFIAAHTISDEVIVWVTAPSGSFAPEHMIPPNHELKHLLPASPSELIE